MKKSHIILLIFMVVAIGAIISTVVQADTYASFEQARQQPGRDFHIIGQLVREQPVEEKIVDRNLLMTFFMTDQEGETTQVHYMGAKPQDFEKSDQVVLIGRYHEQTFVATSLLLKCPSKYDEDDLKMKETTF
ncbi:MAG: cytochrome c maturation protein CcmE [Bacteroidales bacterium]